MTREYRKHGLAKKAELDSLYKIWRGMRARCYSPSCTSFSYYGGRGIRMCDEWFNDPLVFKEWAIENDWASNLEIDRIDNDGDYSSENCRVVSHAENSKNRRLIQSNNSSGYRGVYWNKQKLKWMAYASQNKVMQNIGAFTAKEKAAKARDRYVIDNNLGLPLNFEKDEL